MATSGVLFKKALPTAIGGRILSWAVINRLGSPIILSIIMVMAPVEYIPAATMNNTPTVSIPELLKPFSNSSDGASLKVSAIVRAPRKITGGGDFGLDEKSESQGQDRNGNVRVAGHFYSPFPIIPVAGLTNDPGNIVC